MGNLQNRQNKLTMSLDRKHVLSDMPGVEDPKTFSASKLCDCDSDSSDSEHVWVGNRYRIWEWHQLQTLISSSWVSKNRVEDQFS